MTALLPAKSPITSLKARQAEVTARLDGLQGERRRLAEELSRATARHLYHGENTDRQEAQLRRKIASLDREIDEVKIELAGLRDMERDVGREDAQLRLKQIEKQRSDVAKQYLQGLRERRSLAAQLNKVEQKLVDLVAEDRALYHREADALLDGAQGADTVARQRLADIEATADAVQRDTDRALLAAAKLGIGT